MVRVHSSQREQAFYGVEAVHFFARLLLLPVLDELANVAVSVFFVADEIAIERQNCSGFVDLIIRIVRLTERRGCRTVSAQINWFKTEPTCGGKFFGDDLLKASA